MSVMEDDERLVPCPRCEEVWTERTISGIADSVGLSFEEVIAAFKSSGCPALGMPCLL